MFKQSFNIAFSNEKVVWSLSGENYTPIDKQKQSKTFLNKYVGGF